MGTWWRPWGRWRGRRKELATILHKTDGTGSVFSNRHSSTFELYKTFTFTFFPLLPPISIRSFKKKKNLAISPRYWRKLRPNALCILWDNIEHLLTNVLYCSVMLSGAVTKRIKQCIEQYRTCDRILGTKHGPSYSWPSFGMRKLNRDWSTELNNNEQPWKQKQCWIAQHFLNNG